MLERKVTQEEANAYDPLRHEFPCTADNFKLHLEGTRAHPWNKAARSVFAASFCAKYPHYTVDEAGNHFGVHVESLIRKYKTQQRQRDDPDAKSAALKRGRQNTRKSTVSPLPFNRRQV
jgi:hypothetical protein